VASIKSTPETLSVTFEEFSPTYDFLTIGDAIATKTDGSKILRYQFRSPLRGFGGALTECPMWAGTSVEFVKDLPAASELVERLWRECEAAPAGVDSAK
jgi:hypothetical protein